MKGWPPTRTLADIKQGQAERSKQQGIWSHCGALRDPGKWGFTLPAQSLSTSWLSYFPNQSSERSPSKQVPIIPLAPGVNFLQKEILS